MIFINMNVKNYIGTIFLLFLTYFYILVCPLASQSLCFSCANIQRIEVKGAYRAWIQEGNVFSGIDVFEAIKRKS